jgi:hypothetical protein
LATFKIRHLRIIDGEVFIGVGTKTCSPRSWAGDWREATGIGKDPWADAGETAIFGLLMKHKGDELDLLID